MKENIYSLKDIHRKYDDTSKEVRNIRKNEEELNRNNENIRKELKKKDEIIR